MSQKQSFEVQISIPDLLSQTKEESLFGLRDAVFGVITRLLVAIVEAELSEFIGAGWHERNAATRRTTRAGYRKRRFTILGRDVMLRIPRARVAGFRSQFLPYRKRRESEFDRWALEAYLAGASTRETTAQLHGMFQTSVSPTTVSALVKTLDEEREAFQTRRLPDDYAFLVLDGMYIRSLPAPAPCLGGVPRGQAARKLVVLLVRGITADGRRDLIDFRLAEGERERAWEDFLRDLYDRGLEGESVRCFVHDGSDGLEAALDSVYGAIRTQRCICHKLANAWDAVEDKDKHTAIRKDASLIYDAETVEDAHKRLAWFGRKWTRREPEAVATLRRDFDDTLTYLTVPVEYRRWIRTSNPLERLIRELRRRTRPMGTFQGIDSCRRLLYVAVKKISHERRNSVPYSLWTSQPHYGRKRRRRLPTKPPALHSLWKEAFNKIKRGISRIAHFA